MKFGIMKNKLLVRVLIIIAIVFVIVFLINFKVVNKRIITSSTLTDMVNISELSASKFTYFGIAEVYKDEKKERVKGYIKYKAEVKAGIDMKEIRFDVDNKNKIVKPILPEIKLNLIAIDEKEVSFIPENTNIELQTMISICKEDAETEVLNTTELFIAAEENLKNVVEALILPVLKPQGYVINWE